MYRIQVSFPVHAGNTRLRHIKKKHVVLCETFFRRMIHHSPKNI